MLVAPLCPGGGEAGDRIQDVPGMTIQRPSDRVDHSVGCNTWKTAIASVEFEQ